MDTERLLPTLRNTRMKSALYGPFSWLIREKQEEWGGCPVPRSAFRKPEPGEYRLNVTRILDIDGTKAEDLTKAELEGLKQVHKVLISRKNTPLDLKMQNSWEPLPLLVSVKRDILNAYTLTVDDVKDCRVPDDTIAVMATNMDTHNKNDPGEPTILLRTDLFWRSLSLSGCKGCE